MRKAALGLIAPITLIGLWELLTYDITDSFTIAAPSRVIVAFAEEVASGNLPLALVQTLYTSTLGLLIGGSLGLIMGLVTGLMTPFARLLAVTFEILRSIPAVVIFPVALITFGFGVRLELTVISFSAFWPVLLLTQSAVTQVEPRLIEVSRALGMGFVKRIHSIVLPAILPFVFVAFRLAIAASVILSVTVEILGNPMGLGYQLMQSQQFLQPAMMFAYFFTIGLLGWSVNAMVVWSEKKLFPGGFDETNVKNN